MTKMVGGFLAEKLIFKSGYETISTKFKSINEIPATGLKGERYDKLGVLMEGKKALILVNVASG